jgi:hypothetical protein
VTRHSSILFVQVWVIITCPPRAPSSCWWAQRRLTNSQRKSVSVMATGPFECQRHRRNFECLHLVPLVSKNIHSFGLPDPRVFPPAGAARKLPSMRYRPGLKSQIERSAGSGYDRTVLASCDEGLSDSRASGLGAAFYFRLHRRTLAFFCHCSAVPVDDDAVLKSARGPCSVRLQPADDTLDLD